MRSSLAYASYNVSHQRQKLDVSSSSIAKIMRLGGNDWWYEKRKEAERECTPVQLRSRSLVGGPAPPTNGSREVGFESQGGVCGEDSEEVDRKEDSTSMSMLSRLASVRCGAVRCGVVWGLTIVTLVWRTVICLRYNGPACLAGTS